MSDPTFSDNDFKNKMVYVLTTLNVDWLYIFSNIPDYNGL